MKKKKYAHEAPLPEIVGMETQTSFQSLIKKVQSSFGNKKRIL